MLVMIEMTMDLRKYIQQNHNQLTWKEKIRIAYKITSVLYYIHFEKAIHRDLHSGNVLFNQIDQSFDLSDLGFCGPADKPLNNIYGNLPYIAPEVIVENKTTFASDIYSIGMLMWEISSGHPPFVNKHNYDLAIKIINGMRPRIIPGTPLAYKELMKQCWDADPTKRPDINILYRKIIDMRKSSYQNEDQLINNNTNVNNSQFNANYSVCSSSINSFFDSSSSRIYNFKNFKNLLPRNATKGKV
jgi:serine/threonine protein kinase